MSCKKTDFKNEIPKENFSTSQFKSIEKIGEISSDGRMLIFHTSETFTNLLNYSVANDLAQISALNRNYTLITNDVANVLKDFNFPRYSSSIKSGNAKDYINDDHLNEILNKDQIVQIGSNIYRLNKQKETVYMLPVEHIAFYDDLVKENTTNKHITVYSTNDDVLSIVESDYYQEKGIFCSSRKANLAESYSNTISVNQTGSTAYTIVRYEQYGLSFKIEADVIEYSPYPSNLRVYVAIQNSEYKARCGESMSGYSHPWLGTVQGSLLTNIKMHRAQIYSGVKRLEKYSITVRGRIEDYNQTSTGQTYTTYFTNWITISDY